MEQLRFSGVEDKEQFMELTVKELIQKLSQYPSDLRVLVEGYEDGYSDILNMRRVQVAFNRNTTDDWNGPHQEDPSSKDSALVLMRGGFKP